MPSLPSRLRSYARRTKPYRSSLVLIALAVILSGLWVGARGLLAARELDAAQREVTELRAAGEHELTRAALTSKSNEIRGHAHHASRYTGDVVWKLWSRVPVVGRSLTVVSGVSHQLATLTDSALPALVNTVATLPDLRRPDGSFDVAPLRQQSGPLDASTKTLARAITELAALPHDAVGPVERARARFQAQLINLAGQAQGLAAAAHAAPELLGFAGTRRYLIAVQNGAEARASGGIVGGYGVMRIDRGTLTLEGFGPDSDLRQVQTNAIDFGAEWRSRYDLLGQARDWREVTATPDFPTAAKAMLALWAATNAGEQLNGVVSIDPGGLADILQATGPISSKGGRALTSETLVKQTLSDAYRDFPTKADRSRVLSDDARTIFESLTKGAGAPLALGERMGHAVIGGHLKLYSSNVSSQRVLASTSLAAALPVNAQPFLAVITQDGHSDKLTYYLHRTIQYDRAVLKEKVNFGDGLGARTQEAGLVTITLANTAPASGLPEYVAPTLDIATGKPLRAGEMLLAVSVYSGRSGQLLRAQLNGKDVAVSSQTEQGMSIFTLPVTIQAGTSATVTMQLRQPITPGQALRLFPQPMVNPDQVAVRPLDLGAWTESR